MTPYEGWHGKKPDLSHIRIFGSEAYLHVPKDERTKFDSKSVKCNFVGYSDTQKGYRLWNPETKKVKIGRDVIFNECVFGPRKSSPENEIDFDQPEIDSALGTGVGGGLPNGRAAGFSELKNADAQTDGFVNPTQQEESSKSKPSETPDQRNPSTRDHPVRERKAPVRWHDERDSPAYAKFAKSVNEEEDPQTFDEAMTSSKSTEWLGAMREEIKSLNDNKTWVLATLPPERTPIKSKWIFKTKFKADGSVDRFKARLVAKGFSQREGLDYTIHMLQLLDTNQSEQF